jgi:hypothetical protein
VAVLRGKHATTDWRIIGVATIRNATALRRFKRLRVQRGVNITSTVAANADQNGLEFIDCTLKLVTKSFTNTRCKVWQNIEWEAVDGNGQSPDAIPAADVSGYLCTGRGTTGNPKVMNSSNGVFAIPAIHDLVCEVSQESNVGSLGDSGEWYQHDKEHRDGTTLTDVTFIGAEDGTAFRIYEVAALSNPAGNNDSYPAPNPFGQVVFDRCRGNAGPSALGQGHTPGSDIPGTDRVRFKNGTLVGAHANATGGSSQAFNNQSGPSTVAGAINNAPAADPNYLDAILVAQVTGNRFVRMSAGAQHPNGGTDIWAMLAAWGIQQSALTSAQAVAALQAANTYAADWGRSADAANFLNSRPGGGPEGPGRRLRTFYCKRAGVANGANSAARDTQYLLGWAALAAQDMANHPAFGGAHPDFVASLDSAGLRTWVSDDWAGGPAFPTVGPTPVVSLTPSGLTFNATQGGGAPASQTIAVTEASGGALTGLGVSFSYGGGWASGLSGSFDTTTAPATLTVSATQGVLAPGTYTAMGTVSGSGATSGTFNVTLIVAPDPVAPGLGVSETRCVVNATVGGANPPAGTIGVRNVGGGVLNGLALGAISYGGGWASGLTATLNQTTAPAVVTFQATTGALAVGKYTATVSLSSSATGAVGTPQTLTFEFGVEAAVTTRALSGSGAS